MTNFSCPFCSSSQQKTIVRLSKWNIVACTTCTNAWTVPPPGAIAYEHEDFHSNFGARDIADLPTQWQTALKMQANLLESHMRLGATILEIGCGEGFLLRLLSQKNFSVYGIEASISSSKRARDAGLDVRTGYFPDVVPDVPFDGIILSQVLEHIADPVSFLNAIARRAPGALLLNIQTNYRGLMPRLFPSTWYAWVPEQHFWHFTPKGLSMILRSTGIEPLVTEYASLVHGNRRLSQLGAWIPTLGDQFHLLSRINK
ncbi:MAG: class I SAM-dependent methyltransferase [Bacteroidota bacterium]